jgi:hypothetical protein
MPMKKLEHPALDHLAATPDIFRALLAGLSDEDARWKPAPERFSIAEVLEHVSHVEAHCFRSRLDHMLAADNPDVEPYDQNAFYAAGTYSDRDPEESLAHWEEQREDNLELLRGLEPAALSRTATHPVLGQFTLAHMLNEWAFHDLAHVRQIAELVRARLYYPELGPLQSQYTVQP